MTEEGYGIGYKMMKDLLGFSCSTYHHHANGDEMINALEHSITDIAGIVREVTKN